MADTDIAAWIERNETEALAGVRADVQERVAAHEDHSAREAQEGSSLPEPSVEVARDENALVGRIALGSGDAVVASSLHANASAAALASGCEGDVGALPDLLVVVDTPAASGSIFVLHDEANLPFVLRAPDGTTSCSTFDEPSYAGPLAAGTYAIWVVNPIADRAGDSVRIVVSREGRGPWDYR